MKHLLKYNELFSSSKRVLIIHGYGVNSEGCFYPWLKSELEKMGYVVDLPSLPDSDPNIDVQIDYIMENYPDKMDIIIGHSLGSVAALKLIEKLDYKIDDLILVSGFIDNNFYEGDEDIDGLANICDWKFNFNHIISKIENIYILRPEVDTSVTTQQTEDLSIALDSPIHIFKQTEDHACGETEPGILNYIKSKVK